MIINDNVFKCINILSNSTYTVNEMINDATPEVDQLFGTISQHIISLIAKVKHFTREIFIIERYITCEKARKLYNSPEDIPEDIKTQIIQHRNEDDICLFTLEPCTCDKNPENLLKKMNSFLEDIAKRRTKSSDLGSKLSKSLNKIKGQFETFSNNISKIIQIAEKVDLIAINAYVEAARMGEKGKGFEIIAENIRKASLEIQDLGRDINLYFGELDDAFNENNELFQNYRDHEEQSRVNDEKATEIIKDEILLLVRNFVRFITYTSDFSHEIFTMVGEIQQDITTKLQYVDINNQRIQNIGKKLTIVIQMIETLVEFLNNNIEENVLLNKFLQLEDNFKKVATVYREAEITADRMDYDLSAHHEVVGEKLEDAEGDVELF